jgi:hypothetical protein
MPTNTCTPVPLFFSIQKIKSRTRVLAALRHNKRAIQAELGACSHIDPTKIRSNYCLDGFATPEDGYAAMTDAVQRYNHNHIRKVRHDAVFALETVFSLPAGRTDIDLRAFFEECLTWCKREFPRCNVLSADVHLDEAHPHMHVLMGCVCHDQLIGSRAVGHSTSFNRRNLRFFDEIGKRYGLATPSRGMNKKERKALAHLVLRTIQRQGDPMLQSKCYDLIRKAIDANPIGFAVMLGVEIPIAPRPHKRMRTSTQIFISKGKGRNTEEG